MVCDIQARKESVKEVMIKRQPKKFFIILMVIILLLMASSVNQYFLYRNNAATQSFTAADFALRSGVQTEEGCVIDTTYSAEGEEAVYTGVFTYGPYAQLGKGIYNITIYYETDSDGQECYVNSNLLPSAGNLAAPYRVSLPKEQTAVTFSVTVQDACKDFEVLTVYNGQGMLTVKGMDIVKDASSYLRNICCTFLLCVVLVGLYGFYLVDSQKKKTILLLAMITALTSYPLFTDFLLAGHDMFFHLSRIEGIKTGLLAGEFPVKIHPYWMNDYGYAVGVFYGDSFLYLPALLSVWGFSLQEAYKVYVFAINLATVLIGYKCFARIFKSERVGIFASFIYAMTPYRLSNVYLRGSVGEYTALVFLPMVLCGFYLIFTEDVKRSGYWRNFLLPAFGLTGIIQSHIISCELVGIAIIVTCLIMINKVIQPKVFMTLAMSAVTTMLLNLGFLIPFLSYFGGDFVMNRPEWYQSPIQGHGLYLSQLFAMFQNGVGSSTLLSQGVQNEMPMGVGLGLGLGLVLFLFLWADGNCQKEKWTFTNFIWVCGGFATVTLLMATEFFPWNRIATWGGVLRSMVYNMQFPWRFLTLASLFLTVITCFAFRLLKRHYSQTVFGGAITLFLCVTVVTSMWFFYDTMNRNDAVRIYDVHDLGSMHIGSSEYLPADTDVYALTEDNLMQSEEIEMTNYSKNGTTIVATVANGAAEGYVELPLLYYDGYVAEDTQGLELTLEKGTNNVIRLLVPANYEGEVKVAFREPVIWRIAEVVSAVMVVALAILLLAQMYVRYRANTRRTIQSLR